MAHQGLHRSGQTAAAECCTVTGNDVFLITFGVSPVTNIVTKGQQLVTAQVVARPCDAVLPRLRKADQMTVCKQPQCLGLGSQGCERFTPGVIRRQQQFFPVKDRRIAGVLVATMGDSSIHDTDVPGPEQRRKRCLEEVGVFQRGDELRRLVDLQHIGLGRGRAGRECCRHHFGKGCVQQEHSQPMHIKTPADPFTHRHEGISASIAPRCLRCGCGKHGREYYRHRHRGRSCRPRPANAPPPLHP